MRRARDLAERCFALARSTTFAGEREAAIARGTAIAEKAGLDLDTFDIPGRAKAMRGTHAARPQSRSGPNPRQYTAEEIRDLMRANREQLAEFERVQAAQEKAMHDLMETLRRRATEVGAADDETVYDARRRNFVRATAEAKARDAARASEREAFRESWRQAEEGLGS